VLTLNKLIDFGADVKDGLMRCMNKEDFYLMLVNKSLSDNRLSLLEHQINTKDYYSAFETAHTLKGMYSNLSLTPLTVPISKMTELLRNGTDTDYTVLLEEAKAQFHKLCNL
jgi:HPt (histidine-containing phosphotransfer) domain-containing protein